MYRFQAVPHIGQGALHNDTHGIVDIGFLHFLFDVDRNDFASCDGLTFILLTSTLSRILSCGLPLGRPSLQSIHTCQD